VLVAAWAVQAWLQPVDLPLPEMLKCKATGRPLDFLLQVRRATHTAGLDTGLDAGVPSRNPTRRIQRLKTASDGLAPDSRPAVTATLRAYCPTHRAYPPNPTLLSGMLTADCVGARIVGTAGVRAHGRAATLGVSPLAVRLHVATGRQAAWTDGRESPREPYYAESESTSSQLYALNSTHSVSITRTTHRHRPFSSTLHLAPLHASSRALSGARCVHLQGDRLHEPGAVRAFRSQLPRANEFYGFEPAAEHDLLPPALQPEQAQRADARDRWAEDGTDAAVGSRAGHEGAADLTATTTVYPEYELSVEPESDGEEEEEEQHEGEEAKGQEGDLAGVDERTAKLLREYKQNIRWVASEPLSNK